MIYFINIISSTLSNNFKMVDLKEYINEEHIENKDYYYQIKDEITCQICFGIIYKPRQCTNCRNVYCKICLENWNNRLNYCPNKCPNVKYSKCSSIAQKLSLLKIICKNCNKIIEYDDMENHVLSQCDTLDINYRINKANLDDDGIFKVISNKSIDKQFYQSNILSIKSKLYFYIIISILNIVFCIGSSRVGKTSLIQS